MDYRLRRQPDGTVNAEPGDAVEYLDGSKWRPATYWGLVANNTNLIDLAALSMVHDAGQQFPTALEHVRHARGGAGWHRLREARLRAALLDALDALDVYGFDDHTGEGFLGCTLQAQAVREALADLDNVEPST